MTRPARTMTLLALACVVGLTAGEFVFRSPVCREAIARFFGRGELRAIVRGVGIYPGDGDLEKAIVEGNLRYASRGEAVAQGEVEREMNLLRAQFGDEETFAKVRAESGLSLEMLRRSVTGHLQARAWLEKQIAGRVAVTDEETRQFYANHRAQFTEPRRFRASHLFLAAHDGMPAEAVEAKRAQLQQLATRIASGESIAQLAAKFSEDEATKAGGGDLGFFTAERAPADFVAEIEKLSVGRDTLPFRTPLGFHIARLTELKPARPMSFDELRAEIATALANEKRAVAVSQIRGQLRGTDWIAPSAARP